MIADTAVPLKFTGGGGLAFLLIDEQRNVLYVEFESTANFTNMFNTGNTYYLVLHFIFEYYEQTTCVTCFI